MSNTVIKDLFIKAGYDPEKEEDIKKVFDQAGKLNGEFGDGVNTFVEQFGESVAAKKYNWFKGYIINMNPKKSRDIIPEDEVGKKSIRPRISNSDINSIVKCIIQVLGGTDADLWEFKAMNALIPAIKVTKCGTLTFEQKEEIVQQAYDARVSKAEDMRREAEEKAAKKAASAVKRVKKADAEILNEINAGAAESVDDILNEIIG